jgi:transcriptional regulator with XRE-family HTH domain
MLAPEPQRHTPGVEADALAACLRSWRDRLSPGEAGLPVQARRRAPGLRRQELAQLAGLSVDYLTRLEQGRARHPSAQVVAALARALRLSDDEQAHLFRLAGHAAPGSGRMSRHLTPGIQRVLDRLDDVPVVVLDAAGRVVAWNPLAAALLGDFSAFSGRERNLVWRHFTGAPSRLVRNRAEKERFGAEAVADLHAALARYPADEELRELIADLRRVSPRFESLWRTRPAAVRTASRKTFDHPEVGRITLDCDVLTVHGSDLRVIVYTAPPGTPDADALALVGVLGLQRIGG